MSVFHTRIVQLKILGLKYLSILLKSIIRFPALEIIISRIKIILKRPEISQITKVKIVLSYIFEKTQTALVWVERAIERYKYTKREFLKI